eukprot:12913865-Alexandrium_andersonii.AAC.1
MMRPGPSRPVRATPCASQAWTRRSGARRSSLITRSPGSLPRRSGSIRRRRRGRPASRSSCLRPGLGRPRRGAISRCGRRT